MSLGLPFLTSYDPAGDGEGSIDPLGLAAIAEQLANILVPAVRERMQRIRFLTAMVVGAYVREGMDEGSPRPDAVPYLAWEWLVVEALMRSNDGNGDFWGVPGTLVTKRALANHDYLDARTYLKTPRIFGFHGVYKRLAVHLGLVDVHLAPGFNAPGLLEAWAEDQGLSGPTGIKRRLEPWRAGLRRSLEEKPPRTKPGWGGKDWAELAAAFAPGGCAGRERRHLRKLLLAEGECPLGAFNSMWKLQAAFGGEDYREEILHERLRQEEPGLRPLLGAIEAYERFARGLVDAFEILLAEAGLQDARGYDVPDIACDPDFQASVRGLHDRFAAAHTTLGEAGLAGGLLRTS